MLSKVEQNPNVKKFDLNTEKDVFLLDTEKISRSGMMHLSQDLFAHWQIEFNSSAEGEQENQSWCPHSMEIQEHQNISTTSLPYMPFSLSVSQRFLFSYLKHFLCLRTSHITTKP